MTATPPPAGRPLARSAEGRVFTGVCAGLGRFTGIDPVLFRVAFAVLLLGAGVGFYLYLAAFLLMRTYSGEPGHVEQWTHRDFTGDTVLALLTAVLGFGLTVNLATEAFGTGTLVVATLLALGLLAAHARGVDLLGLARAMPERLNRRGGGAASSGVPTPSAPTAQFETAQFATTQFETAEAPPTRVMSTATIAHPAGNREETAGTRTEPATPVTEPAAPVAEPTESVAEPAEPVVLQTDPPAEPTAARPAVPSQEPAGFSADDGPTTEPISPVTEMLHATAAPPRPPQQNLSYGAPFAPHGPFQPLDPRRRPGFAADRPASAAPQRRPRRPRSFIGVIITLLTLLVGGIVAVQQTVTHGSGLPGLPVVGGAMLATVGAGLLVAAWWGRGAGLIALGTMLALIIATGLLAAGLPRRLPDTVWTPVSMAQVTDLYQAGVGESTLDLTRLPLAAGSRTTFNASLSIGELVVLVPPQVRTEVYATARLGEIRVEHTVKDGTEVEVNKVLEPSAPQDGKPATVVLRIRSGVGDVVVKRAA